MEHCLPLFHKKLDTLFDYLPGTAVVLEPLAEDAAHERFVQIADYFEARREALEADRAGTVYKPLPPDALYLSPSEWRERLEAHALARTAPFEVPDKSGELSIDCGGRPGRNFAPERTQAKGNVFDSVRQHVEALQAAGKRVTIAMWSEGARDRMSHVLADHRVLNLVNVPDWPSALRRA